MEPSEPRGTSPYRSATVSIPPPPRLSRLVVVASAVALLGVVQMGWGLSSPDPATLGTAWVVSLLGLVLTLIARSRLREDDSLRGRRLSRISKWVSLMTVVTPVVVIGGLLFLVMRDGFTFGRPVRRRGRRQTSRTRRGRRRPRRWAPDVGPVRRFALARLWAGASAAEDASVAAFEELHDRLTVLGAPAPLLARLARAAEEECDHAARCLALAGHYAGGPYRLGRRPRGDTADRTIRELCIEQLVDGCLGEALAAGAAARGHERADDVHLRATLAKIAADEARHAEDAWAVLTFLLPLAPAGTTDELGRTLRRRSARPPRLRPPWTYGLALDRHGFVSRADERELWSRIVDRARSRLDGLPRTDAQL